MLLSEFIFFTENMFKYASIIVHLAHTVSQALNFFAASAKLVLGARPHTDMPVLLKSLHCKNERVCCCVYWDIVVCI